MHVKYEDIAADLADLDDRIADADSRVQSLQKDLATAAEVYDRLVHWRRGLGLLAEILRDGPRLWEQAREQVQRIADAYF